ncbi:MAG: tRNA (adenosine(37)-N6)-dimethylallyltransferase MiaA [Actinomycetaceae bacterium]|nr:tRNA (adenosine(37)-N6)-dimethylallyltransferase MiaA [Arcanobacterium sp.]MDD7504842.1 tRNA (adenosine(37)-N6)-dimethylallyltransferase MiaA [Actinomycetaceae bacterium]MDY6142788.1 tRNA (adenosine(37)-N6)-dimethylallyltransferase MiaA [Arcanobacterium sp.]
MVPSALPILAVVGPTASGKTAFSIALAQALGGSRNVEIVSADAFQLYRGMDVGTAKITPQQMQGIAHHQIDVLDILDEASVAVYQRSARADIEAILDRGKIPILVGGSGLYVSAALDELDFPGHDPQIRAELDGVFTEYGLEPLQAELRDLDPASARTIDMNNPRRVIRALEVVRLTGKSYTPVFPRHTRHYDRAQIFGIRRSVDTLNASINARVVEMFDGGLLEETQYLASIGLRQAHTAKRATGYTQALDVIDGKLDIGDAIEQTQLLTRRLAKKQRTWFRADPRIRWLDLDAHSSPEIDEQMRSYAHAIASAVTHA